MKIKSINPTENPARASHYIRYLDNCRGENLFLNIKQLTYDLLNIKEGDHIIDVGCGIGEDVRAIAKRTGKTGKVIGLCNDEHFIDEAKKRSANSEFPVEFLVCDAHTLPYPENSFNGCRAERVFEHLSDPAKALSEMIRIAKPGGRIVVAEPDLDTYIYSASPLSISRKITQAHSDSVRNGTIGNKLFQLFKSAGLKDIEIIPQVIVITDYSVLKAAFFEFEKELEMFVNNNVLTEMEKNQWLASLEEMQNKGLFFASGTLFIVAATK